MPYPLHTCTRTAPGTEHRSLPDPLKQFVDNQVAAGRYSSASEYVREMIRAHERRAAEDALEAALLDGLKSPEIAMASEDWDLIRATALACAAAQKQGI